ncbi:MAG TPA: hypothetical protein VGC42_06815 [Kofleriaceae bacterium]
MPSFDHEILVQLFRNAPRLATELLRICTRTTLDAATAHLGSIDLSQIAPTAYHADVVVLLRDDPGRIVTGIIIEVQLQIDRNKLRSWPAYVANLRSDHNCPAILLVIAPDPRVATWAKQSIDLGHPGFQLTPIVLSYDDIPYIYDRKTASDLPEISMLSTLAHRERDLGEVALKAIRSVRPPFRKLYLEALQTVFGRRTPRRPWRIR